MMDSGGPCPASPAAPTPCGGLDDVLAYLRRRRRNAETRAEGHSEICEWARDRARQLTVIIEDLEQGCHIGSAMVEARIAGGEIARREGGA